MMKICLLLVALDNWYGSARLPRALKEAGFEVGLLSPANVYAAQSRHVDRRFPLVGGDAPRAYARAAWRALDDFVPAFIVGTRSLSVY